VGVSTSNPLVLNCICVAFERRSNAGERAKVFTSRVIHLGDQPRTAPVPITQPQRGRVKKRTFAKQQKDEKRNFDSLPDETEIIVVEGCEEVDFIVEIAEILAEQAVLDIVALVRHDAPLGAISGVVVHVAEPDRA